MIIKLTNPISIPVKPIPQYFFFRPIVPISKPIIEKRIEKDSKYMGKNKEIKDKVMEIMLVIGNSIFLLSIVLNSSLEPSLYCKINTSLL